MVEVYEGFDGDLEGCREMMETVRNQREKLDKEVERWCQERGVEKGR
jgi:indoleamine 2,3-dioxygenase